MAISQQPPLDKNIDGSPWKRWFYQAWVDSGCDEQHPPIGSKMGSVEWIHWLFLMADCGGIQHPPVQALSNFFQTSQISDIQFTQMYNWAYELFIAEFVDEFSISFSRDNDDLTGWVHGEELHFRCEGEADYQDPGACSFAVSYSIDNPLCCNEGVGLDTATRYLFDFRMPWSGNPATGGEPLCEGGAFKIQGQTSGNILTFPKTVTWGSGCDNAWRDPDPITTTSCTGTPVIHCNAMFGNTDCVPTQFSPGCWGAAVLIRRYTI